MTTVTNGQRWDAQAEFDIAVMIEHYLATNPAPSASELAPDFALWSRNLKLDGCERLQRCGVRPLRPIGRDM
jgi:hypothetical protein